MARILVADSLPERRNILCTFLRGDDHVIIPCSRDEEAIRLMRETHPDLIITEGTVSGTKVLTEAQEYDPTIAVIMIMVSPPSVEQVVELMKQGVGDFLVSPLDIDDVQTKVERALANRRGPVAIQIRFHNLVGSSHKMQEVFRKIVKAAATDSPVLILGEKGTGKHLTAREIHHLSRRKDEPFKVVHCEGLAGAELESELFGHEPGAFVWAVERRRGQLELSDRGAVYLDEIGELTWPMQAKLLRFLEEQTLQRLGGSKPVSADVRVLTGSCQPLLQTVQEGSFREDVYYRLSANLIALPPLRARVSDIPELADHFLTRYDVQIAGEAVEILMNYSWPGNVDELKNAIEQAVALCDSNRIELKDIPPRVLRAVETGNRKYKYIPKPRE
jgi:DNA-binding NtrC family response regulator